MFYVGQKVVCVDEGLADDGGTSMVRTGLVYTISGFVRGRAGEVGVTLEEIEPRDRRIGWHIRRFRPVRSTETGMLILKSLLLPVKQDEPA